VRKTWPVFTIIALLLGGLLQALFADGSIDTRMDLGDPLRTRLVVEVPETPLIQDARIIVWTRWSDPWSANASAYRVGTDMPGFALGPLSLTGGIRELGSPHPSSARGSAWREVTGARLDASIDPVSRRGFSFSPQFLPIQATIIQTDDGLAAAASIGSWFTDPAPPARGWVELTAAASRPAPSDESLQWDPAEIGWFEREPKPADVLHLLCRAQLPIVLPATAVEIGPAAGVSLSRIFPPGWWWRLAVRTDSPLDAVAVVSISSARYRLPFTQVSADGAVVTLAASTDLSARAGVTAAGRLAMAWQPEAAVPGVAFTLLGLYPADAKLDLGAHLTTGRWRAELATGLGAEWEEVIEDDATTPVRTTIVTPELIVGVRYAASLAQMFVPSVDVSVTIERTDAGQTDGRQNYAQHISGAGEVGFGPIVSGSDRFLGLSAIADFANDDEHWSPGDASVGCRVLFHAGPARYRGRIEVEWDFNSADPVTWNVELGWSVRAATTEE